MANSSAPRRRRARTPERLPLPDQVVLVLQGGGALGAYQGGVVQGLADKVIDVILVSIQTARSPVED